MSETGASTFTRTSRLLVIAMVTVAIAAALFFSRVRAQERTEAHFRDHEASSLKSLSIASRVSAELTALSDVIERPRDADRSSSPLEGASTSRVIESIREELQAIALLHQPTDRPELSNVLRRVLHRFERMEAAFSSVVPNRPGTDAAVEIASLSLAVEQMRRLESIAATAAIEHRKRRNVGQARSLALWGTGFAAAACLAGVGILATLRRGFERERAMRAAIETSREQLLHSQKIEALGTLAGGVAHDFNNLLTVILGQVEFLLERPSLGEAGQEEVRAIERAAQQAASLTRQLLTFSRREVREARPLDLNGVVADMRNMLHRLVGVDVTLLTCLDPELVPVRADRSQIEQVILNLVVNARDAMPDGGTVTLETANSRLDPDGKPDSGDTSQRYALLSIRDTGDGIPAELRDRIFEPFFTTKSRGEGTGLGLSMVHGIVTHGGGFLSLTREPGGGARFQIYFPECDETPTADEGAKPVSLQAGSETILLAEDQHEVRAVSSGVLRAAGYQVLEAADGADALRICRERRSAIDLILTDVVMPNLKGPELVEQAKPLHPEARVLYMSGYTGDEVLGGGFVGDSEQLIRKPFRPAQLLERVRLALEK